MKGNPWHKRYHSDALSGYMGLSLEERGAYTTLLDMLYDRGEPIPENERLLAGYFGVSVRKARALIGSLVEKRKIVRTGDGFLTNKRFESELKTSRKHAENGSEGGRKRAENEKNRKENNAAAQAGLGNGFQPQKPEARDQIERDKSLSSGGLKGETPLSQKIADRSPPPPEQPFEAPNRDADLARFPEFWAAYPLKENRSDAEGAWIVATLHAAPDCIIEGAKAYAIAKAGTEDRFLTRPTNWLAKKRWTDELSPPSSPKSDKAKRFASIAKRFA